MNLRETLLQPRVLGALGLSFIAAVLGLWLGWNFGVRVGGTHWLGAVAALCGAAFCSLMADALVSRVLPQKH